MNLLNYADKQSKRTGIKDGEIVKILILGAEVPYAYGKEHNEKEQIKKEEAETLGDLYEPQPPSMKKGGIKYKGIIVKRKMELNEFNEAQGGEKTFKLSDKIILPDYSTVVYFEHYPPETILNLTSKRGVKYGNMLRDGGTIELDNGLPVIGTLFPNVNPLRETNANIPWAERMTADKVPEGQQEQYKTLLEADHNRKLEWKKLIDTYNSLEEIEAIKYLKACISRRLLLCNITREYGTEPQITYITPEKGVLFTAKINVNGKYKSAVAFEAIRAGKKWSHKIYSDCQVKDPDKASIEMADAFIEALEEKYMALQQKDEQDADTGEDDGALDDIFGKE